MKYQLKDMKKVAYKAVRDITADLIELEYYHPPFNMLSDEGEFTSFLSILNYANQVSDVSRRPSVTFKFTGLSCTGPIEHKYDEPNEQLMLLNQIPKVPIFPNSALDQVVMTVKTVKTMANDIQLQWTQPIPADHVRELKIHIDPNFDYTSSFDHFRSGKTKNGFFAVRVKEERYELVMNTLEKDYDVEAVKNSITSAKEKYARETSQKDNSGLMLNSILEQKVYSGGILSEKIWDVPMEIPMEKR